ncbi:iron-containing alcohol dehydrogenase [Candidatus Darwinibacter acetoxidans]|jgi:alcohol dehydrogenase YqhD (iron-dependent ADH family)|nr:iron-containing alcohol dehydrogenase [Bacillota bacterium]
MLNFTFSNTTKIVFGKGVEEKVGKEAAVYGRKVLLHYGGGHIVRSGLKARVEASLREAGLEIVELGGVQPNPRLSLVQEGIELVRREKVDFILAVGGGSVIDSAKAIAIGVPYEGNVWDFYAGKADAEESMPVGVVLTIPAAGSEASPSSVITNEDGWLKRGYTALVMRPKFALMNPELTFSLPPYQTACGVSDMMAHIMERYFTNEPEVGFSDHLCEAALRSIIQEAPKVIAEPENYGARANIMWAGTIAHNDLLGMGRSEDWSSHNIEHELSAIYDIAHGAGLSIVFPAWMKYVYKHNINRFVQFAVRVFGVEQDFFNPEQTVLEGIRRLEEFYRRIGLPVRLQDAEIPADRLEEMAAKATANDTFKLGAFLPLGQKDVLAIYELCR